VGARIWTETTDCRRELRRLETTEERFPSRRKVWDIGEFLASSGWSILIAGGGVPAWKDLDIRSTIMRARRPERGVPGITGDGGTVISCSGVALRVCLRGRRGGLGGTTSILESSAGEAGVGLEWREP